MKQRFKEYRKKAGLTQAEAAKKVGVTQSSISYWEKGKTTPSVESLFRMAEVYGCKIGDLVTVKEESQ